MNIPIPCRDFLWPEALVCPYLPDNGFDFNAGVTMFDLAMIGLGTVAFGILAAYARACARL